MKPLTQILHLSRSNEKKVPLTCPQCKANRHIQADRLANASKPVKARCSCGCKFRLILDHNDENVTVVCPQCKVRKRVKVEVLSKSSEVPKVRCRCGCKFRLIPERDVDIKKVVKLSGLYTKLNMSVSKEFGLFHMQQLSLTGLTFDALSYHSIQVGEFLSISFILDNTEASEIRKTVVVKHVDKQSIQVAFCHPQKVETVLIRYLKAS